MGELAGVGRARASGSIVFCCPGLEKRGGVVLQAGEVALVGRSCVAVPGCGRARVRANRRLGLAARGSPKATLGRAVREGDRVSDVASAADVDAAVLYALHRALSWLRRQLIKALALPGSDVPAPGPVLSSCANHAASMRREAEWPLSAPLKIGMPRSRQPSCALAETVCGCLARWGWCWCDADTEQPYTNGLIRP